MDESRDAGIPCRVSPVHVVDRGSPPSDVRLREELLRIPSGHRALVP